MRRWRREANILSRPCGARPGMLHKSTRDIQITDAEITHALQHTVSVLDLMRTLGVGETNTNLKNRVLERIQVLGYTITHLDGRRQVLGNRGFQRNSVEEILQGAPYRSSAAKLKRRLIESQYKQDVCEKCGQGPSWNGAPLTLQLDHIDGNPTNNRLENLRVLCPNCHTQTPTYGSKKRTLTTGECGKCRAPIKKTSRWCATCAPVSQERTKWPTPITLRRLVWEMPVSKLAEQLGVTDVAIKKRCKRLGINTPPRGYWAKQYAAK